METLPALENEHSVRVEKVGVSVLVPAYNEEKSIGQVVAQLCKELGACGWPFEIIAVDDGSTDGTAERAEASGVRLVSHTTNRGYGAALKTGIHHASYDLVCTIDADSTYPTERVLDLVEHLTRSNSDMVVGARVGENVAIPLVRRPAKWTLGRLAAMIAGEPIPDLNSGLRVFHREAVLRLMNLLPDGFSFTTTLTLAMLTNGYVVSYVPINYDTRVGRSKFRPLRDTLNFVNLILRIALYFSPLKIFLPVSGLLLLLAVLWGLFTEFVLGELADVSSMVIAMAAVQVGVVGLLAELVNRRLPNYYQNKK
ncbi:glycosyltransferase family 2 protein [Acidobacteria bacterium AH-259-D05]|nr:glycosyltransferase family 2 protein [Acidobacteria bacterium AH-259-D05]